MTGESAMTMGTSLNLHEEDANNYETRDEVDSIELLSVEFCDASCLRSRDWMIST